MKNGYANDVLLAFRKLGYVELTWPHPLTPKGGWYALESSGNAAKCVAYLDYKPRMKAYDILPGVFNGKAVFLLKKTLDVVSKYAGAMPSGEAGFYIILGWLTFPAGVRLGWPSRCIPDPQSPDSWAEDFNNLKERLLSPLWSLRSPGDISSLLLNDEPMFQWASQDVFMRTSYIVDLLTVCGNSPQEVVETTSAAAQRFANRSWNTGLLEPMVHELSERVAEIYQQHHQEFLF